MKYICQGWKGSFYDSYFNRLDKGEWVKINWVRYIYLKLKNYRVRIIKRSKN